MSETTDDAKPHVWYIEFTGTLTGEMQYDDNDYYELGYRPFDLKELYNDPSAAQAECDRLNATTDWWDEDGERGPFVDCGQNEDAAWDPSFGSLLPWPQFCDWVKENGLPRPTIDEVNDDGGVVENADSVQVQTQIDEGWPDREEMAEWYEECTRVLDGDELETLLSEILRGPRLYEVRKREVADCEIDELEETLLKLKAARKAAGRGE